MFYEAKNLNGSPESYINCKGMMKLVLRLLRISKKEKLIGVCLNYQEKSGNLFLEYSWQSCIKATEYGNIHNRLLFMLLYPHSFDYC